MRETQQHDGYPTPMYEEVPARRRAESIRVYGHPGAFVAQAVARALQLAARGLRQWR